MAFREPRAVAKLGIKSKDRREPLTWLSYPFQRQVCRRSFVNLGDLQPGRFLPAEPGVPPGDGSGACAQPEPLEHHDGTTTREMLDSPAPGHGLIRSTKLLRHSAGYCRERGQGSARPPVPNPQPSH